MLRTSSVEKLSSTNRLPFDYQISSNVQGNVNNLLFFSDHPLRIFWKNIFGIVLPDVFSFASNEEFLEIMYDELHKNVKDLTSSFFPEEFGKTA